MKALGATVLDSDSNDNRVFYAAYFRDPDGNKRCVFRIGPP